LSSNPVLQREVNPGGPKCEYTMISKDWSPEVIPTILWKGCVAEDMPFRRNSLWEKKGFVGQELMKTGESEFI
jgi:hypothetical protein